MRSLLVFLSLLVSAISFSQITYVTENFDIAAGQALTNHGWYAHSQGGTNPVSVSNGPLTWNNYLLSGQGNSAAVVNTGEDVNKPFSTNATSGAVYASFLVNVDAEFPSAGEGFFFHLGYFTNNETPNPTFSNLSTAFRARTFVLQGTNPSTQFKLGMAFNATSAQGTTGDLNIGQTYLVVVKYQFIDGPNNDQVSLFVFAEGDPVASEPATPTLGPFTSTASAPDAPAIQAVALRQFNAAQNATVDGIIVRDHWNIALATLLVEEFDYPAGEPLTNHGWNAHSAPSTNPILVNTTGLIFPTYAANASGRAASVTNTGQDVNKQLSENITSGAAYASFMVNVDAPFDAAGEGFFFHFGTYANIANPVLTNLSAAFRARTHVLQGTNPSTQFRLGISLNAALPTATSGDLNIGETYTVVVKYQFVPGLQNDLVSLYVFAQGDDLTVEPMTPTAGPVTNTPIDPLDPMSPLASDAAALQSVVLRQYNANQNVVVDGIIVRNHWDIFVPCVTAQGVDEISSCEPIVWIDGNTYSTSNNTATHLIVGGAFDGCDSLVTLNFTLTPCTQLRAIDCGATNVSMNQILRAIQVGAPNYRFRITGANNGGPGWNNNQFIYDTPNGQNHFRFQFIPGAVWGATYAVEVAVGDGAGNYGAYGNSCNVTLENQTTTQITAATCGATVTMDNFVVADWAPGAIGYRFRIQGANNGGAGWSGNTFIYETTAPVRSFKFNNHIPGALFGETYSIDVAVLSGDGNWLPYGSVCNVTIATPSTQIQASQCGITDVALPTSILADNVVGASGYRFRITGANSANWMNDQFILNRPNRVMQFQMVAGVLAGEVYDVEVAVMDANGNYGAYGSVCDITLAGTPEYVPNNDEEIFMADKSSDSYRIVEVAFGANASHNPFTTEFGIQVLNANDTDFINVTIYDMSGKLIECNAVNPMDIEAVKFGSNLASGMYLIEVRQGSNQAVIRQVKN